MVDPMASDAVTQQMLIPGNKCGLIIGKSGETIRNLQESIGVRMLLIQDTKSVGMQPKPLQITGPADKVEQAKRAIELLLDNDEKNHQSAGAGFPQRSVGEVIVPRSAAGIIIGRGGENVKRLAQESGAKIQFKRDDHPMTQERYAVIEGTPAQIERATNLIWDLVQRSNSTQQQDVCLMHVPANKTGLVIGKGGETIKAINAETGAHVELSKDPPPNAHEKVFVIKGTPHQIHLAQHNIRIKVGDLAPGTPAPLFQQPMAMQQPGFQPQFGAQFNPQQMWGTPANGFMQNPQYVPQANQFYGQQPVASGGAQFPTAQPQASQAAYASMAPQQYQQPAMAAAQQMQSQPTNQAGQPDYSAQWIDYYRSMGLHEHASLIEEQIRNSRQV